MRKRKKFLVIIPKIRETKVYETDFSFKFCRKYLYKSLENFSYEIFEYDNLSDVFLISSLEKMKNHDYILFFKRSDILISDFTIKALLESPFKDKALVPTYNESWNKNQLTTLDFLYHDIPTFYEFCTHIYYKNQFKFRETIPADKDMFLCEAKAFAEVFNNNAAVISLGAYAHKFERYYEAPRDDLIALLPEGVGKILDIGCAKGGYGKRIKEKFKGVKVFGVEMNPELAKEAARYYEKVWIGRFEDLEIEESFDVINMGDVLEHVYDPWTFLKKVHRLLRNNGFLIGSVPNASHWTIIKSLMEGRFEYVPVGLLCVSHIRFFTIKSLTEIMEESGFKVEILKKIKDSPTPKGREFISLMKTFTNASEDIEFFEILFKCKKVNRGG